MRNRTKQQPPTKDDINRILRGGATYDDVHRFREFLRRMQKGFFLDDENQPISARKRLIKQYTSDGLVLFLGAGVSKASEVPNWLELADALLLNSGVSNGDLDRVKRAMSPLITQFELAGLLLGDSKRLVQEIYKALYGRMPCKNQLEKIPRKYEDQQGWQGWSEVLTALAANKTLKAVGDLLISYENGKAGRNPQIHAVMTVNVDNLLELYCCAKTSGKRILTLVDRASVGEHPDEIPVYHLHGTLDARGENFLRSFSDFVAQGEVQDMDDGLLPYLVFRESEYYETIASPVSFINHTPQSFLRRLNALFIGTSIDDLNMRRWLHGSFRERVRHRTKYLREFYMKRYAWAEYEAELESCRHFWLRTENETEKDNKGNERQWAVPKDHVELVMRNLGVQVVWCKDYDDIRDCIDKLQAEGHDPGFGRKPDVWFLRLCFSLTGAPSGQ